MRSALCAFSLIAAAALSGCAHGGAASDASEVAGLRDEVRTLRRDRDHDRRRLDILAAQLDAMARRSSSGAGTDPSPGTGATVGTGATTGAGVRTPQGLAVVRLAPTAPPRPRAAAPAAAAAEPEDAFIFIADRGDGSRSNTGGPDAAPSLATGVDLKEPEEFAPTGYDLGVKALASGDLEGAVAHLERFQAENPRDSRADNAGVALGDAFRRLGLPARALAAYERVVTEYPAGDAVPEALLRYGETCLSLGRNAAAHAAFRRIVEDHAASTFAAHARAHLADS